MSVSYFRRHCSGGAAIRLPARQSINDTQSQRPWRLSSVVRLRTSGRRADIPIPLVALSQSSFRRRVPSILWHAAWDLRLYGRLLAIPRLRLGMAANDNQTIQANRWSNCPTTGS
jgi:hypothetical protein